MSAADLATWLTRLGRAREELRSVNDAMGALPAGAACHEGASAPQLVGLALDYLGMAIGVLRECKV